MVNKPVRPQKALDLARRAARKRNYTLALTGRGKGSHRIYDVVDTDDNVVATFGITFHQGRDMSWTVTRNLESGLEHLFGNKWMEKR